MFLLFLCSILQSLLFENVAEGGGGGGGYSQKKNTDNCFLTQGSINGWF